MLRDILHRVLEHNTEKTTLKNLKAQDKNSRLQEKKSNSTTSTTKSQNSRLLELHHIDRALLWIINIPSCLRQVPMRIFDSFTHELMRNCCSACIDVEKTASIFGFPLRLTTQHYNSNKSTWPEVTREGSPSRPSRKRIKVVPEVRDRVKNALYMFRNAEWGNKSKWSLYTPDYYLPDSMIGLLSNHYPEILSLNDLTLVLQKLGQVEDLPCHSSLLSIYQIINRVIELNSDLLQNNPGTTMVSKSTEQEPMSDASWELSEYFILPGDNSPTISQIM